MDVFHFRATSMGHMPRANGQWSSTANRQAPIANAVTAYYADVCYMYSEVYVMYRVASYIYVCNYLVYLL